MPLHQISCLVLMQEMQAEQLGGGINRINSRQFVLRTSLQRFSLPLLSMVLVLLLLYHMSCRGRMSLAHIRCVQGLFFPLATTLIEVWLSFGLKAPSFIMTPGGITVIVSRVGKSSSIPRNTWTTGFILHCD